MPPQVDDQKLLDLNNNSNTKHTKTTFNRSEFRDDFTWVYDDQPHTTRRKAITKKYPCVKELFGLDDHAKYCVAMEVAIQIIACYLIQDAPWPIVLFLAYTFGGTINHSLVLAIHDIGHNTHFGNARPSANRWMSMFANLPVGFPSAVTFKKYHIDHHRYLGGLTTEGHFLDTDTPAPWEGKFFKGPVLKTIWLFINPAFYALRPAMTSPKPLTKYEIYNIITAASFDAFIVWMSGWKGLVYLVVGSVLALGLHPVSGHFVAEHYNFMRNIETYSYYGPINKFCFNVGYHIEHHDFPFIPGSRYPMVSKLAVEHYKDLPYIDSYCSVIWTYITDPAVGPWARLHRVYDMKTGEILGLESGLLTKWIDGVKSYKKDKNRKLYNIANNYKEVQEFHRKNDHIPACIKFPKYYEL
jgi:sphingolipid delta-4 desaturase